MLNFNFLKQIFTCVEGSTPSGISPKSLLIHSTVSFPFFQMQTQVWNNIIQQDYVIGCLWYWQAAATERSTLLFVGLSIWPIWQSANVGIWLSAVWCRGAEYLHKSLSHHDTETFKHFQYHIPGDTKPACFEYSWLEVRGLGIWKNKDYKYKKSRCPAHPSHLVISPCGGARRSLRP